MNDTPKGMPIECLIDGKVGVDLSGAGRLTFPPNAAYLDRNGKPRRLEWVINPIHIDTLLGPIYNKPRMECFRVAKDIMADDQEEAIKKLVMSAAQDVFVTQDNLGIALQAIQEQLAELKTTVNAMKAKKA